MSLDNQLKTDRSGPRKAFAAKLNGLMQETGLTISDIGARMRDELQGEKFNIVNLSHYKAGRAIPRPRYLLALSKAIGVPIEALLQAKQKQAEQPSNTEAPALRVEQLPDGGAMLHLNQKLPWPVALRVVAALKDCRLSADENGQFRNAPSDEKI